ncbi:CRISPR-associated protein Csx14 [Acidiplasma aeolicum]|jgi:CRISPR-associated Csx14 family protein|uniref:CRISPR-associated protein Csx14 n=1 Tax=Acidiplasma aeolicum TaxID=507754 RepID=UPI00371072B5
MVKTLLINLMGTTPMVATEMYQYMNNSGENIADTIIVYTKNSYVKACAMAASTSLIKKFNAKVHEIELNFNDILNENDILTLISAMADIIKKEREKYNVKKIILNASGGRKIETIILSIYSSIFMVDEVYNIINKNIANINEKFEVIRDKINLFGDDENKNSEIYENNKRVIEEIFYPDLNDVYFLKVPIVRIPEDEINKLKIALNSTFIEDSNIEDFRLKAYKDSGFLTYDKSRIYNTEFGKIIKNFLK